MKKRGQEFEREKVGAYRRVWREERERKKEKNLKIQILNIMSLVKMYEIQFKLIFFKFYF